MPEWNKRIFDELLRWRYRPFMVNGSPAPVCTSITFIFKAS